MSIKAMSQKHESINNVLDLVQSKLSRKPLFYVTVDPERALGLENILKNYFIIYSKDDNFSDFLKSQKINMAKSDYIYKRSADIIKDDRVQQYINEKSNGKANVITFKNSRRFEMNLPSNFKLLNPSYKLGELFENKISQYKLLNNRVKFPKTYIVTLQNVEYKKLQSELGIFVIQFQRGHTGSSTFVIKDRKEYENLRNKFLKRPARISKYINGKIYTINACIYDRKTYIGGLSYQITGKKPFAHKDEATIGNDWEYSKTLSKNTKEEIMITIQKIGDIMKNNGYRGLFGVDLVIEDETNIVYIIEINARQPASVSMFNRMQLENNQIPLSLLHIAEFLNIKVELDPIEYNNENMIYEKASQLFIRSSGKITKESGIYNPRGQQHIGYSYGDLREEDWFLFMNRNMSQIGEERARFQFKKGIITKQGNIINQNQIIRFLDWK